MGNGHAINQLNINSDVSTRCETSNLTPTDLNAPVSNSISIKAQVQREIIEI